MTNKTKMIHIRLTEEEDKAFQERSNNLGETRSRFARKLIREAINGEVDLLTDEQSLLKIAIRQLIGISNNLNQIVTAMHAGNTHRTVSESYLEEVKKYVGSVKQELQNAILKTKKRWVKS